MKQCLQICAQYKFVVETMDILVRQQGRFRRLALCGLEYGVFLGDFVVLGFFVPNFFPDGWLLFRVVVFIIFLRSINF